MSALLLGVSGLGLLELGFLASAAASAVADRRTRRWRSKDIGFADLLNYAAVVDDGVVVCKNGSFLAAWIYEAGDNSSSTDDERNILSARINQALSALGNGWMVHIDAVRRMAPSYSKRGQSRFPDAVTAAIDEERRELFEGRGTMYEGYFVLTATWFPPKLATQKFVELMFDDEGLVRSGAWRTNQLIDLFKREVGNIEGRLSTGLKMTRLKGHPIVEEDGTTVVHDDLLRWLNTCVTGNSHPIVLPDNPIYLDTLVGGQEMWGGTIPRVGDNFVQVVSIDGLPQTSTPGILSDLTEIRSEYRWSTRFIFMDRHEAIKHLEGYRKKWRQKVRGFVDQLFQLNSGRIDLDAMNMVADADGAIAEVNSGTIAQGYYTACIVLSGPDREVVDEDADRILKAIRKRGFGARIETINTLDAFMGSLPGHGVENVRRPLINTLNLADLMPVNSIWTGLNYAPCPMYPSDAPALMECVTNGATPFRLNFHVADVGHGLIVGPTGAGKSVKLALIAAQFRRYEGMSIFCFDKGLSMYPLCKAAGGKHFVVAGDFDRLAFCPLQFLETRDDKAWALDWVATILALNGVNANPVQRNEISAALTNMSESGAATLSELSVTIQDESIRDVLRQYTVDGAMGQLLDASEDGLSLSSFTVFEVDQLMDLRDMFRLPVLLYLFRRIERSLKGQPAIIILDEAWVMLSHEVFRDKIKEWLKTLRKANCAVIMATQSLSDFANSGIFDSVVESTATKIFLPNPAARNTDTATLYHRMGLNDRQIEIIASAIPKRQYYYASSSGRRLYELALGPLALSFLATGSRENLDAINKFEGQYGAQWPARWLESRGVSPTLLTNAQEGLS